jgi:uncharacterized membrane protein YhhN
MKNLTLTLAAAACALLHIRAEYFGPQWQIYLFKPLTMGLILLLAFRAWLPERSRCGLIIQAGLICSLAGDVFLMLPSDRFIPGLVCFLIAHLFYIAAFRQGLPFKVSFMPLAPFLLYGGLMTASLYPYLGAMKLPVFVYTAVIVTMGWQACSRWRQLRTRSALLAFLGVILFILSDSVLALDRFRSRFATAPAVLLGSYYTAQWLIARSIRENRGQAPLPSSIGAGNLV